MALSGADIVVLRKSVLLLVADEPHLRELGSDHLGAAILGDIVDDDDFLGYVVAGDQRVEALAEPVAGVHADNDDGDFGFHGLIESKEAKEISQVAE